MTLSEIEAREAEVRRLDRIRRASIGEIQEEADCQEQRYSRIDKMAIRRSGFLRNYAEEGGDGQDTEVLY
jgi:hypothetical protein